MPPQVDENLGEEICYGYNCDETTLKIPSHSLQMMYRLPDS